MKHALARPVLILTAAGGLILAAAPGALAHQDGCHRVHSCPSDSGSYVCGDLGYDDECPASEPTVDQAELERQQAEREAAEREAARKAAARRAAAEKAAAEQAAAEQAAADKAAAERATAESAAAEKAAAEQAARDAAKEQTTPDTEKASEDEGDPVTGFLILAGMGGGAYWYVKRRRARKAS